MTRHNNDAYGVDPSALDLDYVVRSVERMKWLFGPNRYFRLSVDGFENLPDEPCLLVSNHSGGTTIPDVWGLMFAWYSHFGKERVCHPLAHEMIFSTNQTGRLFSRLGVLKAHPKRGEQVLTELRRDLLVFPGGDRDTWRKWSDRYRVNFASRMGYAHLALKTGVPVVPIAHVGAHHSLLVLTDGRQFAKSIHLHKLARSDVFPVHLSMPWGLGIGPLPHLPAPVHLRYRIGKPIYSGPAVTNLERQDKRVAALDQQTQDAIQSMLTAFSQERPRARQRMKQLSQWAAKRLPKR